MQSHDITVQPQQHQTFRGKNRFLPQSSFKKGGAVVKTSINLQISRHRQQPPHQPCFHFQFYPYHTLQAQSADIYTSGRTGKLFRLMSGSSPSYGTATSYSGVQTSSHLRPIKFIVYFNSSTFPGDGTAVSLTPGQVCHQGDSTAWIRLWQQDLSGTQDVQWLEASYQPRCPQQALKVSTLQNGDNYLHHVLTSARTLSHLSGLQGCLPHADCPCTLTLSQVLVPGTPLWPGHVNLPLHSSSQSSRHIRQSSGPFPAPVSGQLKHFGSHSSCLCSVDHLVPQPFPAARPSHQPSWVWPSAVQMLCVCGHQFWPLQWHSQTGSSLSTEPSALSSSLLWPGPPPQLPDGNNCSATWRH